MKILAIETSCDETAAAVVEDYRVLSNVVATQIPIHARFGGVVPEIASRNHLMAIIPVITQALEKAGCSFQDLDALAVTSGPGLIGSLLVGVQTAKALAYSTRLPLIPVHHLEGHILAVMLDDGTTQSQKPGFPYLALAVSGGHTSLYLVHEPDSYSRLGATVDDAAGEAFDKVAKILGLSYPGGVQIDRLARKGNKEAINFPRPMTDRQDFNFSFAGLKTSVKLYLSRLSPFPRGKQLADIAASFQEAVVDTLVQKTVAACNATGVRRVVIAGGVAANSRLREKFALLAQQLGIKLYATRLDYCTDNAAMIAAGALHKTPISRHKLMSLEPFASGELGHPWTPEKRKNEA